NDTRSPATYPLSLHDALPIFPSFDGVRAITTMISATGPFVHQSFSPFRMYAWPSSVGSAVALILAGSEPTSGSVSANAETAPFRSEEHTSELQSRENLVCRLL